MFGNNISIARHYYYCFVFVLAVFFPAMPEIMGNLGAFIVNILIVIFCIVFFLITRKNGIYVNVSIKLGVLLALLPFFLLPLSMTIGFVYSEVPLSNRDFFDFYRPVLLACSLFLGYTTFVSSTSWFVLPKLILVVCFFIVLLSLLQFSQISPSISGLYTKFMNVRSNRIAVPFVNPYDFAFVMSFFFFFFLFRALFERRYNLIFAIIIFVLIFLTQSRAGFIALVLSIVFLFIPYFTVRSFGKNILIVKKVFFFFIVFFISVMFFIFSILDYIQENFRYFSVAFEQLASGSRINSASVRLEQFVFALDKANDSLLVTLFGNGPAKEQMPYVESIYTYLFYRFGITGFICYWLFWLLYINVLVRILKNTPRNHNLFCFFGALFIWVCSVPLFSISNNLTEQLRTSFIYYSFFGVSVAYYNFYICRRKSARMLVLS